MHFIKLHSLGNDFIFFDERQEGVSIERFIKNPGLSKKICHRNFGVGADQILFLNERRLRFLNADGSESGLCGNGLRAVAWHLFLESGEREFQFKLNSETVQAKVLEDGQVETYFSKEKISKALTLETEHGVFRGVHVEIGNPHFVIDVTESKDAVERFKREPKKLGRLLEHHSFFKHKSNIEWVLRDNRDECRLRVWERGAGLTLACGSGALATFIALRSTGFVGNQLRLKLPGGWLECEALSGSQRAKGRAAYVQRGRAKVVFRGEI